ncbi:ATP-dependent DNA helicase PIF1 [Diplocarpon rosae]|nr:ATP-dependent DNA helicase PIF1 [Diplocarpon rosae]
MLGYFVRRDMAEGKKDAYVVERGRVPGLCLTWGECDAQVKGFSHKNLKSYERLSDAEKAGENFQVARAREAEIASLCRDVQIKSESNDSTEHVNFKRRHSAPASDHETYPATEKPRIRAAGTEEREGCENVTKVELSPEQEVVAALALKGHNIFLTGAGGCGKTVTIREIMARLDGEGIRYEVVAPTGIAALPLGGKTAHSFMGWDHDSMRAPLSHLRKNIGGKRRRIMRKPDILILEEISMVENFFLERMNLVMQTALGSTKPFGGKQVIMLGDFHQLPPVKPCKFCLECGNSIRISDDLAYDFHCYKCGLLFVREDKWTFKSSVWQALRLRHVRLEKIHRQNDACFKAILDKIRYGEDLEPDEWEALERQKVTPGGICAVRLMPRKMQVDEINWRELAAIQEPAHSWEAIDDYRNLYPYPTDPSIKRWEIDNPLKKHRFPGSLHLKVGAKVVLLANLDPDKGLVNGSQGVVVGFQKYNGQHCQPSIKYVAGVGQKRAFPGITCHETFSAPVVRFTNGRILPIPAVESRTCFGPEYRAFLGIRVQIPLNLAWALTIHKSQGMTLDYIEVSSKEVFEKGQLYVALSRATQIEGVTVTGSSRLQLPSDDNIIEFYRNTAWETLVKTEGEESEKYTNQQFSQCDFHIGSSDSEPSTLGKRKARASDDISLSTFIKHDPEDSGVSIISELPVFEANDLDYKPESTADKVIGFYFDPPLPQSLDIGRENKLSVWARSLAAIASF